MRKQSRQQTPFSSSETAEPDPAAVATSCIMQLHARAFGPARTRSSRPGSSSRMAVRAAAAPKLELKYFDITGRAEVARLLCAVGGLELQDTRIGFGDLAELKPTLPFGQVPVLVVDGTTIAQSGAIDHYLAKLAGLEPSDPLQAAQADAAYYFCEDLLQVIVPTFRMPADEQAKARQELLAGTLGDKLKLLAKLVESKPGTYLTGEQLTVGDLAVFCLLSFLRSGFLAGIDSSYLDSYPSLKAFRNTLARVPAVQAYYSGASDDIRKNGYMPEVE